MELYPKRKNRTAIYLFLMTEKWLILTGQWIANSEYASLDANDLVTTKRVRYRTVGDMTCTAAVESNAETIDQVIDEIIATRISERGETRIDDRVTEAAMEDRKKEDTFNINND